jgi:hypothetical protein
MSVRPAAEVAGQSAATHSRYGEYVTSARCLGSVTSFRSYPPPPRKSHSEGLPHARNVQRTKNGNFDRNVTP